MGRLGEAARLLSGTPRSCEVTLTRLMLSGAVPTFSLEEGLPLSEGRNCGAKSSSRRTGQGSRCFWPGSVGRTSL